MVAEGLIRGLSAGSGINTPNVGLFNLGVSLTKKGVANHAQVLGLLFYWIKLVQSAPMEYFKKHHDEQVQLRSTQFQFSAPVDPLQLAEHVSEVMSVYDAEDILVGPAIPSVFDETAVLDILSRLSVENCFANAVHKQQPENDEDGKWLVEPRYGAKYREQPLKVEFEKINVNLANQLKLPPLNAWLATNFDIIKPPSKETTTTPNLIKKSPGQSFYHRLDTKYKLPKTSLYFKVVSSVPYETPKTMTATRIFDKILRETLTTEVSERSERALMKTRDN